MSSAQGPGQHEALQAMPAQWMGQPHRAAWVLVGALAVLIAGALLTVVLRRRTLVRTLEQT
ncbi:MULTISPECIES: hypothetical protein [Xanthomonas]|uniref:hypothetical protein n=1 Tax=Xanthomonas TaxID=338 RepID=UPI002693F82D